MSSRILPLLIAAALLSGCPMATMPVDAAGADGTTTDLGAASDAVARDTLLVDSTGGDAGAPIACSLALMGAGGGSCLTAGETCSTPLDCRVGARQCTCNAGRWDCRSIAPPPCQDAGPPDVTVVDGGPRPDGGTCPFIDTYSTSFMGMRLYFRFDADGTWTAAMSVAMLGGPESIGGTYTYSGGEITILDDNCGSTAGLYRVTFDVTCNTATLSLISDPCPGGRSMVLDGLVFQRERPTPVDAGRPDVISPPDSGPAPDASPPVDGGSCSIVGVYDIDLAGTRVVVRFNASGAWAIAMTVPELDTGPFTDGTYSFAGGTLRLEGDRSCAMGDVGLYSVGFNATCSTATLTLRSDDCTGRGSTLDGSTLARR